MLWIDVDYTLGKYQAIQYVLYHIAQCMNMEMSLAELFYIGQVTSSYR